MGLLDSLLSRSRSLELDSLSDPRGWLARLDVTGSGVAVNEQTALNFLAVYACVSILADSIAMLPAKVLRRDSKGAQPVPDHPAAPILSMQCNTETTAMVGRQVIQAQALLGGVGYAEIERDKSNRPIALWPIHWRRVTPRRHPTTGELLYDVAAYADNLGDGGVRQGRLAGGVVPDTDMFRLPGLSLAGLRCISPVAVASETIGAGLAADRWLASFFGNGAWPGGFIKTTKPFKDEDHKRRYLESLNARHQGAQRAFRIGLLEEGADFVAASIPAEDAQLLELRADLRREIARLYRVPPHLIADLDRATFSNIEEQGIAFVVYSLLPWIVKWEQECGRKLLTSNEQRTHYVKVNPAALLRGNTPARYEAYAKGIQSGFLSPDEARELEDLNPIPGGKGRVWLFPLNAEQIGGDLKKAPPKRTAPEVRALAGLLQEELDRARRAVLAVAERGAEAVAGDLTKMLPVWERALKDPPRILSGAVRATCRAVAYVELGEAPGVDVVAEGVAGQVLTEQSERMVRDVRAAVEAAHVRSTPGADPVETVRDALHGSVGAAAEAILAQIIHAVRARRESDGVA